MRDYFAAKAMQGAVAALTTGPNTRWDTGQIARWAYWQADAMLEARGERPVAPVQATEGHEQSLSWAPASRD
jgi:hypothetical protein